MGSAAGSGSEFVGLAGRLLELIAPEGIETLKICPVTQNLSHALDIGKRVYATIILAEAADVLDVNLANIHLTSRTLGVGPP